MYGREDVHTRIEDLWAREGGPCPHRFHPDMHVGGSLGVSEGVVLRVGT